MVNLPWAGMTVGGLLPRAGAGSGARTGMILGLGRSLFSLKTLKWEVNILEMQDINKNMTHLNQFIFLTPKMMLNLLVRIHYISPGSDVT